MARDLPPDPKKTAGVVEVAHDSLLCLVVGKDGQKSVLCNELTGEMVKLPACPDDKRLHFTPRERFGFMTIQKKSRWCKEFLMWTVFELHGEQFAYRKTSSGYESKWLSDFTGRFWTKHCHMTLVRLDQCAGSSGCRSFVSLIDALAQVKEDEVTGKFASKKLQRTYIPVIQKHVGSTRAEDHILFSDQQVFASSRSSEESQDLKQLKTPMISIVGFLILMLHLMVHGTEAVKKASLSLLSDVLSSFGIGPECHESEEILQVFLDTKWKPSMKRVGKGHIQLRAGGAFDKNMFLQHASYNRLLSPQTRKALKLNKCPGHVVELIASWFSKNQCQWLSDQLLFEMAKIIETRIVLLDWQRNESMQVASERKSRNELAKDARSHRKKKKEPSKSSLGSFAITSISSRKKGQYIGFDKRQQQQLTRYWLGARQQFSQCNIVAMSGDEARVGGKSRFYGALMNLLTGKTCWGPPQDSCDKFTYAWFIFLPNFCKVVVASNCRLYSCFLQSIFHFSFSMIV